MRKKENISKSVFDDITGQADISKNYRLSDLGETLERAISENTEHREALEITCSESPLTSGPTEAQKR